MPWQIELTKAAQKDLEDLKPKDQNAIAGALDRLAVDPGRTDLRKLAGTDEWRMRVGRYRVRFVFQPPAKTITVLRILPRDKAYR